VELIVAVLEIVPEPFLVLFWSGTEYIQSGRGTYFVPKLERAKHFSVLSETVATVLVHPLPPRTYDAEQTSRHRQCWASADQVTHVRD